MINPLDVAKEVAQMVAVLGTGITSDKERVDVVELAIDLWEKCFAINNCPNCDMEDPEDAWKHGNPEHDPENN